MASQRQVTQVAAGTGATYWGPGNTVTFLVTGAQSGGACFICEVMAPPGGGPPPHIHRCEEESFYVLQGTVTFEADGRTYRASPGDFVHIPRGTLHTFRNDGQVEAKMVTTVSPAGPTGMQQFFEAAFVPVTDRAAPPPRFTEERMGRMMAAAARNGLEIVLPVGR